MATVLNEHGKQYVNNLISQYNVNDGKELTDDNLKEVLTCLLSLEQLPEKDKHQVHRLHYRLFEKPEGDPLNFNTPWKRTGR